MLLLLTAYVSGQQKSVYQQQDLESGVRSFSMDTREGFCKQKALIPFASKNSKAPIINKGYGFSQSMLDKTMSGAYDVVQTDSFYYIAGRTRFGRTNMVNNELMFSMKIDMQGDIVWRKTDSLVDADHWDIYYGRALTQLSNGKFMQIAFYPRWDSIEVFGYLHPLFIEFDKSGINTKEFIMCYDSIVGWPDSTFFVPYGGLIAEKDAGISVVGEMASQTWVWNTSNNVFLCDTLYIAICKFDSNMNLVKLKKIFINQIGRSVLVYDGFKTSDKGYIISLRARIRNGEDYVVKLDSNYNYQWLTRLGDSLIEYWNPIKAYESNSGGFIYVREHPTKGIAYGKVDEYGSLLWEKTCKLYNDTNQPWDGIYRMPMGIIEQDNGDILFSTRINLWEGAGLVRTDSLGNIKWARWLPGMYGDFNNQDKAGGVFLFNMRKPKGEGALLVGHAGYGKAQLIRTDSLGCSLPNCLDTLLHISIEDILVLKKQKLIVYPNPVQNTVQFAINSQEEKIEQIIIYDINGREIHNEMVSSYLFTYDASELAKGLYIVKVKGTSGSLVTSKFVKE